MRILLFVLALLSLSACACTDTMQSGGSNGGSEPTFDPRAKAAQGEFCGGIAGIQCTDGLYCQGVKGECGFADAGGTCQVQPQMCTKEYRPVCGCDGKTYGNACTAAASAMTILHDGACK